jgi:beta-glucosidase-like glycosyl hydrolase
VLKPHLTPPPRCSNFPSGPSFGATFDRGLIRSMASVVGVELRAMFALKLGANYMSLDCWGPVVNLNRDPRWGRNGEGGLEDAYAMGQLAQAWTEGFQSPRPALGSSNGAAAAATTAAPPKPRTLLQGVMTLKHMAANSLENTEPFNRHTFDANATYGVDPFVMRDYYLRPFERAIRGADARGIMCSYNSALGVPTCLSKVIRGAREEWGFRGYVTSDSDSVRDAYANHHYVPDGENATALALRDGQTDIDSGDTYNSFVAAAVAHGTAGLRQADVDRALANSLRQRFDLGLFDPPSAYAWPGVDDVGTDASLAMSLRASQEALVLLRNDGALLPLAPGGKVAVLGPHAAAQKVLMQPYPFSPFCPDHTNDCLASPFAAVAALNGGNATTSTAAGCDLFDPSEAGFAEALAAARAADTVILGLGIETCGMDPAHNVNPQKPGRCYQEKSTTGYVFRSPLVTY